MLLYLARPIDFAPGGASAIMPTVNELVERLNGKGHTVYRPDRAFDIAAGEQKDDAVYKANTAVLDQADHLIAILTGAPSLGVPAEIERTIARGGYVTILKSAGLSSWQLAGWADCDRVRVFDAFGHFGPWTVEMQRDQITRIVAWIDESKSRRDHPAGKAWKLLNRHPLLPADAPIEQVDGMLTALDNGKDAWDAWRTKNGAMERPPEPAPEPVVFGIQDWKVGDTADPVEVPSPSTEPWTCAEGQVTCNDRDGCNGGPCGYKPWDQLDDITKNALRNAKKLDIDGEPGLGQKTKPKAENRNHWQALMDRIIKDLNKQPIIPHLGNAFTAQARPLGKVGGEIGDIAGIDVRWGAGELLFWTGRVGAQNPTKAHDDDAGWDLYTADEVKIKPGQFVDVSTKIHAKLPPGTWGRICGRSSTIRKGLLVVEGVIDEGYRGELFVGVKNLTKKTIKVKAGDRLAQLIVVPRAGETVKFTQYVWKLGEGSRGMTGFGSSGD